MSNAKPEHYTYTRTGKTSSTVTRDADAAELGTAVRLNRLGGGHMWQAVPPGHRAGDGRMSYQPNKLACARYLDALARVETVGIQVGDQITYDTGQCFCRTATVTEVDGGSIRVAGPGGGRIHLRDIAKAMMKNLVPELTPDTQEA